MPLLPHIHKVNHAKTEREFVAATYDHPDNEYIRKDEPKDHTRPLRYTFTCNASDFDDDDGVEQFFIQQPDGLMIAAATTMKQANTNIKLSQVSVHPEHVREHLATALIYAVMRHVEQSGRILEIGQFYEHDPQFMDTFSSLHLEHFPELMIQYECRGNEQKLFDGSEPYRASEIDCALGYPRKDFG